MQDVATAQLGAHFVVERGSEDGGGEAGDKDDRAAGWRAGRGGRRRSGECRMCQENKGEEKKQRKRGHEMAGLGRKSAGFAVGRSAEWCCRVCV